MPQQESGERAKPAREGRYGSVAIALHWIIAAAFAFQIGLGWRMAGPRGSETFAVYQLHKSVGISILVLTLARFGWRLTHPVPPLGNLRPFERIAVRLVHAGFYAILIGLPLTGWLLVSSSSRSIPTLLFGAVPWPHVPGVAELAAPDKAQLNAASELGHQSFVYVAYLVIALHLAGALKHQLLDRGGSAARMIPVYAGARRPATILAVVAFASLVSFAATWLRLTPTKGSATSAPPAAAAGRQPLVAPPPAPMPPATPMVRASAAAPVQWTVRKKASAIRFHTSWSQGPIDGTFSRWNANILFSPDNLNASTVTATVDMASVSTNNSDASEALPDDDWFATAAHPVAIFTTSGFRHLSGSRYVANATLSLRGVKRAVALPFNLSIKDRVAVMSATLALDRTRFGIGQGQWASVDDVPAKVSVTISLTADRRP